MYDKVKLWIDRGRIGEDFKTLPCHLHKAKEEVNLQTGEVKTYGSVDGLKVSIFASGLSVVGSLPKFLYGGTNIYPLDRNSTAEAIEKLNDALHIKVDDAKVTELEFGAIFPMKYPVERYLKKLREAPRLCRYHFTPQTLYYKSGGKSQQKTLCFYDKLADAKVKGMEFPENLDDSNLLKFELRLRGRLTQLLKHPEIKASTLQDRHFFKSLLMMYQKAYFDISKQKTIKTDIMEEIKTPKDAFEVFVARLIAQSSQEEVCQFLDELKEADVFEDRKSYTRLKDKIKGVASKATITITDELISELDNDVKNLGAYL